MLALGDSPLKGVQKHSKDPSKMWAKLVSRYAGQTTSNKLVLFNKVLAKSLKAGESMYDHIEGLELEFTRLKTPGTQFMNSTSGYFFASINDCIEYERTIADIRTMDDEKTTWEIVTARLMG